MRKPALYLVLILGIHINGYSQYVSHVLEYVPAPSQYMNAAPWGTPFAAESIIGGINGHVSLGAFGGYIVFSFEEPVENDPDNPYGVDFTIFGNPMENWSEPGIVSVMKDENKNGLPDDTWYELAGSDHYFSNTIENYSVTYANPGGSEAADVAWTDNQGNSGVIEANSFFTQSYYPSRDLYPFIDEKEYTLSGTAIASTTDTAFETGVYSLKRGFGYVDNQFRGKEPFTLPDNPYTARVENSGGDAFDISWAIDQNGNYIDLDVIHFIKVHTGVMDGAGWLGQISTEIVGSVDVEPDASLAGEKDMIVIKELPIVLSTNEYQLEVFTFRNGRIQNDQALQWTSSLSQAEVDNNNVLHVSGSGELTLTATLAGQSGIIDSVSTVIDLSGTSLEKRHIKELAIYPNPASNSVYIKGIDRATIKMYDLSGKLIGSKILANESEAIDIRELESGIYFIEVGNRSGTSFGKFFKE